jgi:DNA-binding NarL/FixJ family response regulator
VVSPQRLVAQAVVAALRSTGVRVEFHAWESLAMDLQEPSPERDGARYLVAVFDGAGSAEAVEDIRGFVAMGDVRVAIVTSAPDAVWWGGLMDGTEVDVVAMTTSLGQLRQVIDRFTRGEEVMDQERREALSIAWSQALDNKQHLIAQLGTLSRQQVRVLELLASGRRVQEVAAHLGVAEGTVRSHIKSLRAKLGARTQLEAVAMLRQVREDSPVGLVPAPRRASDESVASPRR